MKSTQPLVSVIIPAYNAEDYINESIQSMLDQSYVNIEIIIINDASTDNTKNIIETYNDNRITLINNPNNLGCAASLNVGINASTGKYIARMDSDDISLPNRIHTQVTLLEKHEEIAGCGTWIKTFGQQAEIWKYPVKSNRLKCELLFRCELAHPTTMYRRDILNKYQIRYNDKIKYVEDYDFWRQIIEHEKLCNISEPLLLYRIHDSNISRSNITEKNMSLMNIHKQFLDKIGINATSQELELHEKIARSKSIHNSQYLKQVETWLIKIYQANNKYGFFPKNELNKLIYEIWYNTCRKIKPKRKFISCLTSSHIYKTRPLINRMYDFIQACFRKHENR